MSLTLKIQRDLEIGWEVTYFLNSKEVQELKAGYIENGRANRYTYNSMTKALHVVKASPIHFASSTWMADWVDRIKQSNHDLDWFNFVDTALLQERFAVPYTHITYTPDGQVRLRDTKWPTIALVVGYTKSYNKLLLDAELLLEGSRGETRLVIVVKAEPLKKGQSAPDSGFVETHLYDPGRKKRVLVGPRGCLYPTPDDGSNQHINLPREIILGPDYRTRGRLLSTQDPPALKLKDLRREIDRRIRAHLEQYRRITGLRSEGEIPRELDETAAKGNQKLQWNKPRSKSLELSGWETCFDIEEIKADDNGAQRNGEGLWDGLRQLFALLWKTK